MVVTIRRRCMPVCNNISLIGIHLLRNEHLSQGTRVQIWKREKTSKAIVRGYRRRDEGTRERERRRSRKKKNTDNEHIFLITSAVFVRRSIPSSSSTNQRTTLSLRLAATSTGRARSLMNKDDREERASLNARLAERKRKIIFSLSVLLLLLRSTKANERSLFHIRTHRSIDLIEIGCKRTKRKKNKLLDVLEPVADVYLSERRTTLSPIRSLM